MNPKISVIVPVYNAENFLARCIDSLLNQTFSDFEVLLIDDGSPDRSGIICDEYARKDSRIRAFHKENGGVSAARQYGMERARGEYTIHADSDDWVSPTMLEELYGKALEENADMVVCDFIMYYSEQKQKYICQQPSSLDAATVLKELFLHLHGSCCNKLVRLSCYKDFNVRFPTRFNLYEDLFVNTCILTHSIKVAYLNKAFYYYAINLNTTSMVKRIDRRTMEEDRIFFESMIQVLDKNPQVQNLFKNSKSYSIVLRAFKSQLLSNEEFVRNYKKYRKHILQSPEGNILGKLACYLSCLGLYGMVRKFYR